MSYELTGRATTRLFALGVLLVGLSAPLHAAYPVTVKDARGKSVTIKAKPVRIVSLTPSNTEILFAVGLNDRIVGVTRYCDYPTQAKKKAKVGDMTISAEAVAVLRPDLVLAHAKINDDVIPRLERLGMTVFAIDPKSLDQVISDIRTVGKITARPRTADSVARRMESDVAAVKSSRSGKRSRNVLVVIQANPLWCAGPKTFVDEMITIARGRNVAYDARPGFNTFSRELALKRNPDVVVVGIKDDADLFLKSPLWRHTNAVRHNRVHVIEGDFMVRAGPRLTIGLKRLAEKLGY